MPYHIYNSKTYLQLYAVHMREMHLNDIKCLQNTVKF